MTVLTLRMTEPTGVDPISPLLARRLSLPLTVNGGYNLRTKRGD
jgi:hypothetical protein